MTKHVLHIDRGEVLNLKLQSAKLCIFAKICWHIHICIGIFAKLCRHIHIRIGIFAMLCIDICMQIV